MKRITLKKPPSDVLVTLESPSLGSHEYTLLALTREIEEQLDPLAKRLTDLQDDENATPSDRVTAMAEQLDVMLKYNAPNGDTPKKDAPKPSAVLTDCYEKGETTQLAVATLVQDLVAAGRPI